MAAVTARPTIDDHRTALLADVDRFVATIRADALGNRVAACPDWNLGELVGHLGSVHHWATQAVVTAAQPPAREQPADTTHAAALTDWYRAAAAGLVAALDERSPDDLTWSPFTVPPTVAFWWRRQAHEIFVHRIDAELAADGVVSTIDPLRASDAIDEWFEAVIPRVLARTGAAVPDRSLHVHCTDVDGEWFVAPTADGGYRFERVHTKGDAALRGTAAELLLILTGRAPADPDLVIGDVAALDAWRALPGF